MILDLQIPAVATGANMGQDLKPAGEAAAKVKVSALFMVRNCKLISNSHAVYAKTRRPPETNVCCSAMPKTPRKTALPQSTSTKAVWQDLDSSFHNDFQAPRNRLGEL